MDVGGVRTGVDGVSFDVLLRTSGRSPATKKAKPKPLRFRALSQEDATELVRAVCSRAGVVPMRASDTEE
jgi:hypothetical protein